MSTDVLPDSSFLSCELDSVDSVSVLRGDGVGGLGLGKRTIDSTNLAAELKILAPEPLNYWISAIFI
jgi:hypothetical protein